MTSPCGSGVLPCDGCGRPFKPEFLRRRRAGTFCPHCDPGSPSRDKRRSYMAAYQKAYQARPENRAAERARKASRHYLDRLTARRLERQAEDPGYTARIARQKREQYLRRQAKTNGT